MKKFTMILIALAAFLPLALHAQVVPKTTSVLTLSATTVASGSTAAITSGSFTASSDSGFAVIPKFALSGTYGETTNVTFKFQASADGTNWTTGYPLTYTVAATGTTPVIGYANFAPRITGTSAVADNVRWWRLGSIVNSSTGSALNITSVTVSKNND